MAAKFAEMQHATSCVVSDADSDMDSVDNEPQKFSYDVEMTKHAASNTYSDMDSIRNEPQKSSSYDPEIRKRVASNGDSDMESTGNEQRQRSSYELEVAKHPRSNTYSDIESITDQPKKTAFELALENAIRANRGGSDAESDDNEVQKYPYHLEITPPVADENEEEEEDDDLGNQGINLALLPILLLMLALQISFLLSQYIINSDDGMPASVSLITAMCLGIVAMITLFQQIWAGKVHLRDIKQQSAAVNSILRDNLSLVGIIFFCPFACLLDIFQIYTEISCGESWKLTHEEQFYITDVSFCILHITFMTLELLFCVQFRRLQLSENVTNLRRFCVKLSMTVIVAANIGLWFNVVLDEITRSDSSLSVDQAPDNGSTETYEGCLWSSFSSVEQPIRLTLYPFSVEFSLLVLEFFASHMMFSGHRTSSQPAIDEEEPVKPPSRQRRMSLKAIFSSRQCFIFGVTSPLVILFGVFSNLLCITLAFFSREEIFGAYVLGATIIRNQRFLIFYWLLILLSMVIGFVCAWKFKTVKGKLQGIDYIVMVTAFGPFICSLIRIIVVIENIDTVRGHYDPTIVWLPEVLSIVEVTIQLPFMFLADSMQCPSEREGRKPKWRIFKAALLSVAMCNITWWLLESISFDLDLAATIFPGDTWTVIDGIFRPLSIFFRFNSFLILLRAFLL